MASNKKNLSGAAVQKNLELKDARIGIITSDWNSEITGILFEGCVSSLKEAGVKKKNLVELNVPGSFELPSAAKMLVESKKMDAVICLGCIIKGETRHDEYISQAVARGIMDLNLRYNIPFIFGVLTTDNMEQARDRAGGQHGNKGVEAAASAMKMMVIKESLKK
ncbi:MAG: 6,7-dimethyl-8-ribityllumazine synthase [Chitinophagales bacterium]